MEKKQINKQIDATLTLARHVISSKEARNKNTVFSPLSINVVLSLMANGYKEGPTQDQFLSFFSSKSMDDLNSVSSKIVSHLFAGRRASGPTPTERTAANGFPFPDQTPILSLANSLWLDSSLTLKPSFKQVVCNMYKADIKYVDFANKSSEAFDEVNVWAEEKTNGLIKNILPRESVNELTQRISANAIYFKGAWEKQFNDRSTKDYNFYLQNGDKVKAPFMRGGGVHHVLTFDDFKVAKLPYKRGNDYRRKFSMYIFLPNTNDGLPALFEKMTSGSAFLNEHLPENTEKIWVGKYKIPTFKFGFGLEATDVMKKMGLDLPFKMGGEPITEMSETPLKYGFSCMFHKACIEVNEEGTEAAAATMEMRGGGGPTSKPVDFVADHPFAFLIREDITGSILFLGQVMNPLED